MYSAGFGRVNRTVWHRSPRPAPSFRRKEPWSRAREGEGWFSSEQRVGRAYPNLFSKRPAAYRIDDLYYYYSSSYSRVTLRHPFPFLPPSPGVSCNAASSNFCGTLPPAPRTPLFRAAPPLPLALWREHHVCGIFLRKIDRPSDCLSCPRLSSLLGRFAPRPRPVPSPLFLYGMYGGFRE